jgi:primary-amine oxidase
MASLLRFIGPVMATVAVAFPISAQAPRHPLDPLTWEEHWAVLEVLRSAGHLNDSTRFTRVALVEPDKASVWSWQKGQPFPRSAHAVIKQQARTFEAVIDVVERRLRTWQERPGVQPNWLAEDFGSAGGLVKSDTAWQRAMRRRGYTDFTFVDCLGIPPGNLGEQEFQGRRIAKVMCTDATRFRNNWGRGIQGLHAFVDLNAGRVVRVVDDGSVPLAAGQEYDALAIPPRPPGPPLLVSQPLGAGFKLDGNEVTWENWSFHLRMDQRAGAVISTVRWRDGDRARPVMYAGHLSEIFVPYMDPSLPWYSNNFLDAGEFTMGGLAKPLEPGTDCPEHAAYLHQQVTTDNGRPAIVQRAVCLFERAPGDPAWRHQSAVLDGRPKRDLVIRFAAVLGNYDYVFDWTFQQDGTIRVGAGATGIAEVKTVAAATAVMAGTNGSNGSNGHPASAERPDRYGRFVAPNIVAVNHDHWFNFRIDLDVGGTGNSFELGQLKQVLLPKDHPRRSLWVMEPMVARTEAQGKLHMDMERPALWRVTNPAQRNRQGYPVSMELRAGMNAKTLLSDDDWPRRRAGFIDHHLWVTPYHADERYAAGDYPTLSRPGEGLPKWTAANRAIEDTDIVLWYTMGFHHVVRAEDWPVMPVSWHTFEIRPFDFFDANPAMNLPLKP